MLNQITDSVSPVDRVTLLAARGLLRETAYIDGRWCRDTAATIDVTNPASGETIGTVPAFGASATHRAIEAAARAFPAWTGLTPGHRAEKLLAWHRLILEHKQMLAELMTLEQGKPLIEALGEIEYAADFVQWFGGEARRLAAETPVSHLPSRHTAVKRVPVGVCAAVTPWNFPTAMVTRKAAAALAVGCTMVVRPASETPFSALALAALAEQVGIPAGVLSVVTGDAEAIVGEMCRNPLVRALSFTGSTPVGRRLLAQAAATVKKVSMELGGHAPFIVFSDVNLDSAVAGALTAKFVSTGQDCLAANRIYVHRDRYEPFLQAFAARVRTLQTGDGFEPGVTLGPLMHARAVAKCQAHVDDARGQGARVLTGGGPHRRGGNFFAATVLADVTAQMRIYVEETFGPVAAVIPFDTEAEVIRRANDSEYGLAAYVYTDDLSRAHRVADALEYGMVAVNCVKMTGAPVPFGGWKQSGLGREGGREGLEEFTELKYLCMALSAA